MEKIVAKRRSRQAGQRVLKGQALLIVLLISTICLVIVSSLALRTVRRIRSSRQAKEYQGAYASALAGVQAMMASIESGSIGGVAIGSCTESDPCELIYADAEDDAGYTSLMYFADEDFVSVPKDNSIDLWVETSSSDLRLDMYCVEAGADAGMTATMVFYDAATGEYDHYKETLDCSSGSGWHFETDGYGPCPVGDEQCYDREDIVLAGVGDLQLVRVKGFGNVGVDSVESLVIVRDSSTGEVLASTGGYRIDSSGYGYGGATATLSVTLAPSGLPYPFDFALFDGGVSP